MTVRAIQITATLTGADGSAGGTGKSQRIAEGEIEAVYLDYHSNGGAGTDVVLTCGISDIPVPVTVLTLTDYNTDGYKYPVAQAQKTDGTNITGWFDEFTVNGYLTLTVSGSNAGEIDVWVVVK